jgi:hypothetical protein
MKVAFALLFVACQVSLAATAPPSVTILGNQTDPTSKIPPDRDGGCVSIISGKIVWMYSDTQYIKNGTLYGFYGNTGAIGDPNNPLVVVGPDNKQVIPFTTTELAYNNKYKYNPRYVFAINHQTEVDPRNVFP